MDVIDETLRRTEAVGYRSWRYVMQVTLRLCELRHVIDWPLSEKTGRLEPVPVRAPKTDRLGLRCSDQGVSSQVAGAIVATGSLHALGSRLEHVRMGR